MPPYCTAIFCAGGVAERASVMSDTPEEPKFVRHAKLFELLRQENLAMSQSKARPQPVAERKMSEQELLSRALGSLNPSTDR